MLAHTIHKSKNPPHPRHHSPTQPPAHTPASHTSKSSPGVAHRNQPHRLPPQTPNSAPPGDTTPEGMMLNLLPTTPGQDQPHRPTTPGPLMSPTSPWHVHHTQPAEPACQRLLRKEVIQPHLPVRLPCYD